MPSPCHWLKSVPEKIDRNPEDFFQHQVGALVLRGAAADEPGDVGMLQLPVRCSFCLQAAFETVQVQIAHLEGDGLFIPVVNRHGTVDYRHSASSDLVEDAIVADPTPGHRC